MKRLLAMAASHAAKKWVIINKADLNPEVADEVRDWCSHQQIPVAGSLPFDKEVVNAMVNQKTIVEWAPGSEIARELELIWNKINQNHQSK